MKTHDQLFPYIVKATDANGDVKIYNFITLEDAQYSCETSIDKKYGIKEDGVTLEIQKR